MSSVSCLSQRIVYLRFTFFFYFSDKIFDISSYFVVKTTDCMVLL